MLFSSAVVLCCAASLKFLNCPDLQNDQAIGEFLSFVGELSVRNLTVGLSFCSLLPELIAIISCYKYDPYCTVMGCLPSGGQSSLALPMLKSDFTSYSQKFLQIIITKAEKNSQVSEEASQISFTMDEVKSIIATLTLLLCSMGLDDQLGNEYLKTIITFLSDPDFTSLDSFFCWTKGRCYFLFHCESALAYQKKFLTLGWTIQEALKTFCLLATVDSFTILSVVLNCSSSSRVLSTLWRYMPTLWVRNW